MAPAVAVRGGKVKTPAGDAPLIPLLLLAIGGYLAWFGVHYWRDQVTKWPSDPVKDVLQGKGIPKPSPSPTAASQIDSAAAGTPAGPGGGSVTGDEIAADAKKYAGTRYTWGGSDPARGWDCSGMVSWVLCHDLKLAIPGFKGGDFGPKSGHGPVVSDYLAWGGVTVVGSTGQVQAGDLLAWGPDQHIGIAVSGSRMISAENPSAGTVEAEISGFSVSFPIVLRLKAAQAAPAGGGDRARNQATASLIASRFGWAAFQDQSQWDSLVQLWETESGWSVTATNPNSGAYGIPQSLPGSKMARFGAAWKTSARIQIEFGLWYIRQRYGSPAAAWQHEQAKGWY